MEEQEDEELRITNAKSKWFIQYCGSTQQPERRECEDPLNSEGSRLQYGEYYARHSTRVELCVKRKLRLLKILTKT